MTFFYQIGIRLFYLGIILSSVFNRKARLFIQGRKNIFIELQKRFSQLQTKNSPLVWFHCASLGEFEQARPLIEKFKVHGSEFKVLVTFFSPSGYEIRKNFEGADFIFYLPIDTKRNVHRFLNIVKPSLAVFVKYDFWYNYLNELHKRIIPTYLVSTNFRQEQFNGIYGKYLRTVLNFFSHIFVQNETSERLLLDKKITRVTVSGDLRYDKVVQTALKPKKISLIEHFKANGRIIIAGSTWIKDEEILSSYKLQATSYKLIIAPHQIDESHILRIISLFPDSLRYSEISKESVSTALDKLQQAKVLIIDNIGMLSNLFQYADIAYIGGGFGSGIHNVLEAVAFGVPVIFGPNHQKFPEAYEIIEQGGGFCIAGANDFKKAMDLLLSDEKILKMASMTCRNFVAQRKGATETILSGIRIN